MQAMLLSPKFLFIDSPERHPKYRFKAGTKISPISEIGLASRLSYFLWSSPPDEELITLAQQGNLRKQLNQQVERMLASEKAIALVDNFAGQWLQTRDLKSLQPDPTIFPEIDQADLDDIRQETYLMLQHILLKNRPLTELINGNYSFLNDNLADYYGIPQVQGNTFRKVNLNAFPRRGILTHASILMLTSTPTRTSPVMRGKWILDNILDTPPPPPPPDITSLEDNRHHQQLTLRQQLEKHREKASCAACHKMMDPIGFAAESYDAAGKWRAMSIKDTRGKLFTGEPFTDMADLQYLIVRSKGDDFARCISKKLLTYGLGRGVEFFDRPTLEAMTKSLKQNNFRLKSAILTFVHSPAFQFYRSH